MTADEYLTYTVTDGPWKMQHERDGTIGLYLIRLDRPLDEQITRIARFDRVEDAEFTAKARELLNDFIGPRGIRGVLSRIRYVLKGDFR
ncbi:hypothetical protein QM716_01260 [Rhodococcus sp. IEGM 1409]|uniref:hypothetical protein n=1 Tax=Rhodococcus sp. IEGM 1409 TaxID=3047082 RepID=UPI0024B78C6E|nr:hypothetical protein [Rhodococcus sp. IEGM 1409]MDI9898476.1 hypothetical protein [Rhodococcus sp. IEGM 1409]